jgi:hypothetical protein
MSAPTKIDGNRSRIQTSNESNRSTNSTHSNMTHVETFKSSIIRIRDLLRTWRTANARIRTYPMAD